MNEEVYPKESHLTGGYHVGMKSSAVEAADLLQKVQQLTAQLTQANADSCSDEAEVLAICAKAGFAQRVDGDVREPMTECVARLAENLHITRSALRHQELCIKDRERELAQARKDSERLHPLQPMILSFSDETHKR